jgi:hypothetical protein
VFRVAGIDALGAVELHVQDDGTQSSGRANHIVFVSPDNVEPVASDTSGGGTAQLKTQ